MRLRIQVALVVIATAGGCKPPPPDPGQTAFEKFTAARGIDQARLVFRSLPPEQKASVYYQAVSARPAHAEILSILDGEDPSFFKALRAKIVARGSDSNEVEYFVLAATIARAHGNLDRGAYNELDLLALCGTLETERQRCVKEVHEPND